jgi:hypothetical protein
MLLEGIKGLPEREKVQACAKPAFGNNEQIARVLMKALWEIIATQKDITCLFQTVVIGKIDVVKRSGNRCTLFVPAQSGVFNLGCFHSKGSFFRECQDLIGRSDMTQIYKRKWLIGLVRRTSVS